MMTVNVYEHYAGKYFELGFCPIPVTPFKKACFIKEWGKIFGKNLITETQLNHYVEKYPKLDIGLTLGSPSQIVGVDFDWEGDHCKELESLVIGVLPLTPCIKQSRPGRWTRFYRYSDQIKTKHLTREGPKPAFIDILSTGSLTVIPPSNHSKNLNYTWLGPDLLDVDREDLPLINLNIVNELKKISRFRLEGTPVGKTARHNKIFGFLLKESEWAKDLEHLVQKTLIFDSLVNANDPKGPYFQDKKYFKTSPEEACLKFVTRICAWKQSKHKDNGIDWEVGKSSSLYNKGSKLSTNYVDFASFFEHRYPNTRRDLFTKVGFTLLNEGGVKPTWYPIKNRFDIIESEASQVGLTPGYVKRHLSKWLSEKPYQLLIDIPVWNRKPNIEYMALNLGVTNVEPDYFIELLKEWMVSIFRRIFNPDQQNHFLILRGPQGIGKDFWLDHLVKGLNNYAAEISIQRNEIENWRSIQPLAVARIPEFDETDRLSIGLIKSLVTAKPQSFRAPYAVSSELNVFRTSFCSSSNFKHLLRDSSGNRRYMIFDVRSIRYGFSEKPEYNDRQILAEAFWLYKNNFRAGKNARDAMNKIIFEETPIDNEELFLEEVSELIGRKMKNRYGFSENKVRWTEISSEIEQIQRKYGYKIRKSQSIIRGAGFRKADRDGKYYMIS
jgi:hypothetical protein